MNISNYINDGTIDRQKYPLSVESLDFIQNQILLAAEMANATGNKIIIRGCTEVNNNITAGVVVIAGELFPFRAGAKQNKVRIVEISEDITADFITYNNAKITRYVEFGSNANDANTYLWADFSRIKTNLQLDAEKATHAEVDALRNLISPAGLIAMWSGSVQTIPVGWAICDGQNGTPDLRGRFIVGVGNGYDVGNTGGNNAVILTTRQLPAHAHFAGGYRGDDGANVQRYFAANNPFDSEDGNISAVNKTGKTGANEAHENRPPYYALAYIMKL